MTIALILVGWLLCVIVVWAILPHWLTNGDLDRLRWDEEAITMFIMGMTFAPLAIVLMTIYAAAMQLRYLAFKRRGRK